MLHTMALVGDETARHGEVVANMQTGLAEDWPENCHGYYDITKGQRDPKGSKGYSLLMFVVHVELLHGCWRSNILPYIHIVCGFEFIEAMHM